MVWVFFFSLSVCSTAGYQLWRKIKVFGIYAKHIFYLHNKQPRRKHILTLKGMFKQDLVTNCIYTV